MARRSKKFAAYNAKGWRKVYTGPREHARYGKINYFVYRAKTKGRLGYCAEAKGTGQRRAGSGYKLRNEGHGCGLTARVAIEKAVRGYFTKRARKVHRR
jgi:hypothetical protein